MTHMIELDPPGAVSFTALCGPGGAPMAQVNISTAPDGWVWIPAGELDQLAAMWLAHRGVCGCVVGVVGAKMGVEPATIHCVPA